MWYYTRERQQYGPVSLEALRTMLMTGQLHPDDFVRPETAAEWRAVRDTPELAGNVAANALPHGGTAQLSGQPVVVTPQALAALSGTRPWVRFMGILLFIGCGLMVLGGFCGLIAAAAGAGAAHGPPAIVFLLYPIFGLLYLPPAIYLNRYASRITDLLRTHSDGYLEAALAAQRSFWRYVGILTAVVLIIEILVLLIVVIIAVAVGAHGL